jgi:hypothetical protein
MIWSHLLMSTKENEEIEERIVRFRTVRYELYGSIDLRSNNLEVVGEIRLLRYLKEGSN